MIFIDIRTLDYRTGKPTRVSINSSSIRYYTAIDDNDLTSKGCFSLIYCIERDEPVYAMLTVHDLNNILDCRRID